MVQCQISRFNYHKKKQFFCRVWNIVHVFFWFGIQLLFILYFSFLQISAYFRFANPRQIDPIIFRSSMKELSPIQIQAYIKKAKQNKEAIKLKYHLTLKLGLHCVLAWFRKTFLVVLVYKCRYLFPTRSALIFINYDIERRY